MASYKQALQELADITENILVPVLGASSIYWPGKNAPGMASPTAFNKSFATVQNETSSESSAVIGRGLFRVEGTYTVVIHGTDKNESLVVYRELALQLKNALLDKHCDDEVIVTNARLIDTNAVDGRLMMPVIADYYYYRQRGE